MTEQEKIEIAGINLQLQKLSLQIERQSALIASSALVQKIPELCTLEQACRFKGGSDVASIRRKVWQQPCCGTRSKRCNGRKVWHREEIVRWLSVTDDMLEEYAESLGVDISRYFKNGKAVGGN